MLITVIKAFFSINTFDYDNNLKSPLLFYIPFKPFQKCITVGVQLLKQIVYKRLNVPSQIQNCVITGN